MAAQPRSLAEATLTLNEISRYLSKTVVTVRKWFEKDQRVIKVPRGRQRETLLIPIPLVRDFCKARGIPDDLVAAMVDGHDRRLQGPQVADAVQGLEPLVPRPPKSAKSAKSGKSTTSNKRANKSRNPRR